MLSVVVHFYNPWFQETEAGEKQGQLGYIARLSQNNITNVQ